MDQISFREMFCRLTGKSPLRWQERLFREWFAKGEFPDVIDLPTGLGKTLVMAIWLISRSINEKVPRRLVYVVDRRTVVDQATDLANELKSHTAQIGRTVADLTVSTLRGRFADNREWTRDPSRPAIIIGTVDMIGSRLLFSGYRSSYKQRPLDAGLLGQDSLLILDEAHLSRPFDKLLSSITRLQGPQGTPLRVIRMSATTGASSDSKRVFRLDIDPTSPTWDLRPDVDPESGREQNQVIVRYRASKRLSVPAAVESSKLNGVLAQTAIALATDTEHVGKRIAIFVRSPDDALEIAESIRGHASAKSKGKPDAVVPCSKSVSVLTGTMRGLERDLLVKEDVFKQRWLNGDLLPADETNKEPVFLVSTSAGEVGFDLNADHLVGDAAPLDSWIQRLGRVNRRGYGDASVILFREGRPPEKSKFDQACIATTNLLTDGMDVSPAALSDLKSQPGVEGAISPSPDTVELTDILLDAWSMTSIVKRMPGRPPVGPWLRGTDEQLPQVAIAWRQELEFFADDRELAKKLSVAFAAHPIRPHETLTTSVDRAIEFLEKAISARGGWPELSSTTVALQLSDIVETRTIADLIAKPQDLYAEPTLILPATFGGLSSGMLSHDAVSAPPAVGSPAAESLDVADHTGYEPDDGVPSRRRVIAEHVEAGWIALPLSVPTDAEAAPANRLSIDGVFAGRTAIATRLRNECDLRARAIIGFDKDEDGEPRKHLILLTGIRQKLPREEQPLAAHVADVEREASRVSSALRLGDLSGALSSAARWHDEGKWTAVWQTFIGGCMSDPLGKSARYRNPRVLAGYRHEFGSLLRVTSPSWADKVAEHPFPANDDARDLALHLIAVHHGHSRPHFFNPIDRDFEDQLHIDQTHLESICRFARLQKKYGWWYLAWLENLLRCADAIASEQINDDEYQDEETEVAE